MAPTSILSQIAERAPKMTIALQPVIRPGFSATVEPVRRVFSRSDFGSEHAINLTLTFLGLLFFTLILSSALFLFRRRRLQQRRLAELLPVYNKGSSLSVDSEKDGHTSVVFIGRDGQPMLQNPGAPPESPENVPEIHITFPDEQDENGRQKSGRVLIVRVGDNATIGLEPMQNEQLPAYEKESKGHFQTIDMDRIGGLKEKETTLYK